MPILQSISESEEIQAELLSKEIVVLPTWVQGRVSTKAQVGKGIKGNGELHFKAKASLPKQAEKCREAIGNYRGNCPVCYKKIRLNFAGESLAKGESGRRQDRQDIIEILSAAEKGLFKVLLTIDNDRLARKRSVAVMLRDKLKGLGVQIYSLAQPIPIKCPDCFDPLDDDSAVIIETLSDMKAQLDLSKIRRNYKIGMPNRIEKGKPAGSLAYGLIKTYKRAGLDARGNESIEKVYKWSEEKVEIVKRIAKEFLAGKGIWKIAQKLNLDGIPSPQDKQWGRSAILHILKNPVYAGINRFGWKISKGGKRIIQPRERWMVRKAIFNGIWPLTYYERVQKEFARRTILGGQAIGSESLLVGILKCGYCSYSMFQAKSSRRLNNGGLYQWKGYACGTFLHKGTCRHNGIKQEWLDQFVIKEVLSLANKETREAFHKKYQRSERRNIDKLIKQKEDALTKFLKEYGRISEAYRKGVDSLKEYAENKDRLLPAIKELNCEITKLKAKIKQPLALNWRKAYRDSLRRFLNYPTSEDKHKVKVILSRFIERVEFKRKPRSIKIFYKLT